MERFEEKAITKSGKYLAKGKPDAAQKIIDSALEKNPESTPLLLERSKIMLVCGLKDDAASCVRRILRADSESIQIIESYAASLDPSIDGSSIYPETLAEYFVRQRDMSRAIEALEHMRDSLPSFRKRLQPRADKLLSDSPDKPINSQLLPAVYVVALCDEVTAQYESASKLYITIVDRNPREAEVIVDRMLTVLVRDHRNLALRLRLAEALVQLEKVEPAVEQCTLALEIDPQSAQQVAEMLERLARQAPKSLPLQAALARARARQGRVDECLRALHPLVVASHDLPGSQVLLQELSQKNPEHAGTLMLLSEVSLRNGKSQEALTTFGRLSNPPPEMAEKLYRRVLEGDPQSVGAIQKLMQLLLENDRKQEASELCTAAESLEPDRLLSLVPQLQAMLEAVPDDRRVHLLLARIQVARGERERAGILLRRVLSAGPDGAAEVETVLQSLPAPSEGPESRHLRVARLECSLARGDRQAALSNAEAALGVEPSAVPDVLPALTHLVALDPSSAARLRPLLAPHAERTDCKSAIGYLLGECAAAEQNIDEALKHWKSSMAASPEAATTVRQSMLRLRERCEKSVELDVALVNLELDRSDYSAASSRLMEVAQQRPEAAATCLERLAQLLRKQPKDMDVRIGLCVAYAACKQFDPALKLGEETLQMEDSERTAPLQLTLAEVHIERGEARKGIKRLLSAMNRNRALSDEVIDRLQRMRHRDPSLSIVHLALGRVLTHLDRHDEALDCLCEAWRLDAAQGELILEELQRIQTRHVAGPVLRLLLARIYTGRRAFPKATEALGQLLDTSPDQTRSVLLLVDKILAEADLPEAHLLKGRALLSQGNVAAACGTLERAFKSNPDQAGCLLALCQRAIEAEPDAPEPYLLACDLQRALKRPAAAAKILTEALDRSLPGRERFVQKLSALADEYRQDTSLLLTLAQEYLVAGDGEGALRAVSEAVSRDPMMTDSSLGIVEGVIKDLPQLPEAYLVRASLLGRRGNVQKAHDDLKQFLSLAPSRRADGLPVARQLRKREPRNFDLLATTVNILMEERQYEEAGKLLKEGVAGKADPSQKLQLYLRQWRLHLAQGKEPLARKVLENAQSLAPDANQFLHTLHTLIVERLSQGIDQIKESLGADKAGAKEIETLVNSLIMLGRYDEARATLSRHATTLAKPVLARLHSNIAECRGDYRRAFELRRSAGADRRLVHCAERCGELEEARRLLSHLIEEGHELNLEPRLARYELEILKRELDKDRNVLQAETVLAFST